jgi:hypothetical protein
LLGCGRYPGSLLARFLPPNTWLTRTPSPALIIEVTLGMFLAICR